MSLELKLNMNLVLKKIPTVKKSGRYKPRYTKFIKINQLDWLAYQYPEQYIRTHLTYMDFRYQTEHPQLQPQQYNQLQPHPYYQFQSQQK